MKKSVFLIWFLLSSTLFSFMGYGQSRTFIYDETKTEYNGHMNMFLYGGCGFTQADTSVNWIYKDPLQSMRLYQGSTDVHTESSIFGGGIAITRLDLNDDHEDDSDFRYLMVDINVGFGAVPSFKPSTDLPDTAGSLPEFNEISSNGHYPIPTSWWEVGVLYSLQYPIDIGKFLSIYPQIGLGYKLPYWTSIWPTGGLAIVFGKDTKKAANVFLRAQYSMGIDLSKKELYGAIPFSISRPERNTLSINVGFGGQTESDTEIYYLNGREVYRE
jgi:hypothetical protein